ncbi:MAG: SGNH/GDSL hydrolase family protein, partial [Myxococcota bacterium]|nr:SGNH/GDSL hydrolase family protein [Myxococcota bacterium]
MRDDETTLEKPEGVYRIVIVGDSVAYGLTVDQRHAFPQQLEVLLNADTPPGRRYEVLNLGVSGYNVGQIIERLRVLGIPHAPDLVIYAYSLNDPQDFSLELQGLSAMQREAREQLRPGRSLLRWLSHSKVFLLVWRSFQQPWTRPVRPARQSPDYVAVVSGRHAEYFGELHRGESWQRIEDGLGELAALTRSQSAPAHGLVAILPIHLVGNPHYPLSGLHEKIADAARDRGLEALDLAPALMAGAATTTPAYFNDPFHPSALGHRLAAQGLLEWIREFESSSADERRSDSGRDSP